MQDLHNDKSSTLRAVTYGAALLATDMDSFAAPGMLVVLGDIIFTPEEIR